MTKKTLQDYKERSGLQCAKYAKNFAMPLYETAKLATSALIILTITGSFAAVSALVGTAILPVIGTIACGIMGGSCGFAIGYDIVDRMYNSDDKSQRSCVTSIFESAGEGFGRRIIAPVHYNFDRLCGRLKEKTEEPNKACSSSSVKNVCDQQYQGMAA